MANTGDEIYGCNSRAENIAKLCETHVSNVEHKTTTPLAYVYNLQGECTPIGCLTSFEPYTTFTYKDGSCKET